MKKLNHQDHYLIHPNISFPYCRANGTITAYPVILSAVISRASRTR